MIVSYNDDFFTFFKKNIFEFDVDYLRKENPFLKSFVYFSDNIPVGLISYSLIYDRIELEYIWVMDKFRKEGIASKLMDKMFTENVKNVTLEVRVSNVAAIRLYEKYGFKIVSIRNNYYGNENGYLMIREMM